MSIDQIVGLGFVAFSAGTLLGVHIAEADERLRRDLDEIDARRRFSEALRPSWGNES